MKKFRELEEAENEHDNSYDRQKSDTGKKTSDIVDLIEENSEKLIPNMLERSNINLDAPTLENRIETENHA